MRHLHLVSGEQEPELYEVIATSAWPPVAIPGRPGWWRHNIDGQQVDLPHNRTESTEEGGHCGA